MEAVTIDLSLDPDGRRPQLSGGDAEGDKHEGIEIWEGSDNDDTLKAAAPGAATDAGSYLKGGKGADMMTGGTGIDTLDGGAGDDMFVNNSSGADMIKGGDGTDTLEYKTGTTAVSVNLSDEDISGGRDANTGGVTGTDQSLESIENVIGAEGADSITGSDGDNELTGGEGNDTLSGGKGADMLMGEEGDDSLLGGDGDDMLMGGDGDDTFDGGKGDDMIHTGKGTSTINGAAGDGADTIVLTGEAAAHTTTVNAFQVGSDKIDVSDLLDIDADDIEVAIANATVTGSFAGSDLQYTLDLTVYEGGTLVIQTGRSTDLSSDDFLFGS